jgi:hypothetical protein
MTHYQKPATNYFPVRSNHGTNNLTQGIPGEPDHSPDQHWWCDGCRFGRTVAILSIPAAAHSIDPHPYRVELGINSKSTSAEGFKITTGASVACIAVARFQ